MVYIYFYRSISHNLRVFDILMRAITVTWIHLDYLLLWYIIFEKTITANIGTLFAWFIFHLFVKHRWFYKTWVTIPKRFIFLRVNLTNCLKNLWKMRTLLYLKIFTLKIYLWIFWLQAHFKKLLILRWSWSSYKWFFIWICLAFLGLQIKYILFLPFIWLSISLLSFVWFSIIRFVVFSF